MELYEVQNHARTNEASKIMKLREKLISIRFWQNPANRQELIDNLNKRIPVESYQVSMANCLTVKLAIDNPTAVALTFYNYLSPAYQQLLVAHKDEIIYLLGDGRIDDPSVYTTFDHLISNINEVGLLYNLQYLADNTIEIIL